MTCHEQSDHMNISHVFPPTDKSAREKSERVRK